jgi:AraC family transcriptional regulator
MQAVSEDSPGSNLLFGRQNADQLASWAGGSVESSTSASGASLIYAQVFRHPRPSHFVCAGYSDPTIALTLEPAGTIYWRSGSEVLQERSLPAGVVSIAPAKKQETEWRISPVSFLHVVIADELVAKVAEQMGRSVQGRYRLERALGRAGSPQLNHLLALVHIEATHPAESGALYMDSLAQALAFQLLREFSEIQGRPELSFRGGMARARLRRVLDYIEANLGVDVRLAELASTADLSTQHFSTLFKQSTGLAPHKYLTARRIERAKHLLTHTTISLTDIAAACGFSDQSHFTNVFRHVVKCTPRRWREATSISVPIHSTAIDTAFTS